MRKIVIVLLVMLLFVVTGLFLPLISKPASCEEIAQKVSEQRIVLKDLEVDLAEFEKTDDALEDPLIEYTRVRDLIRDLELLLQKCEK